MTRQPQECKAPLPAELSASARSRGWPIRSEVCFSTAVSARAHRAGQTKEMVQIHQTPFPPWGWSLGTRLLACCVCAQNVYVKVASSTCILHRYTNAWGGGKEWTSEASSLLTYYRSRMTIPGNIANSLLRRYSKEIYPLPVHSAEALALKKVKNDFSTVYLLITLVWS